MSDQLSFQGFPEAGLQFLDDLSQNNYRDWFNANKSVYEKEVLAPAVAFVAECGARLQSLAPAIRFDTRTNGSGSLMRIYRDTRFSKDKTPYKTGLSGMFWEGAGKKTECPAFGFHLEAKGISLMAGQFGFAKERLEVYRQAVVDDTLGQGLVAAISAVSAKPGYEVGGKHYKRVPRGYDAAHDRAEYLLYNGLFAHPVGTIPREKVTSAAIIDLCLAHFQHMAPVEQWLVQALG